LIQEALKDRKFVAAQLGDDVPERKISMRARNSVFASWGHVCEGAKESKPHDHGPTSAICGHAKGETVMSDWELVEPAADGKPGKVRLVRPCSLTPGMAYVYNEGDLHSPRRNGPTRLIGVKAATSRRSAA
jgi:hypothetical protein